MIKEREGFYVLDNAIEVIADAGKKESDVKWVGNEKEKMTWEQFKQHADFQYYDEPSCVEIVLDLMIVADDWYLSRSEEYGVEEWVFNTHPVEPRTSNPALSLVTEYSIKERKRILAKRLYNKKYRENKKIAKKRAK